MTNDLIKSDYLLQPGHLYAALEPALIRCVLGACVAVTIWDRRLAIGGMTHFVSPRTTDPAKATACFGNVSTSALVRILERQGSRLSDLEAQIFGGGHDPGIGSPHTGDKNVKAARKVLKRKGIKVVSEDVGGSRGRKVVFDTSNGHTGVIKVQTIRRGDWQPLEQRLQRRRA